MQDFKITNTNHSNLDGLRAIGILMVIFSHFLGTFINLEVFWTSIDLLFALSGLLITGILIETKEDPGYFKKFYMRRILRIFPLYYLLILLFTLYVFFITATPQSFDYFKDNIAYFLTYTQNWYFIKAGIPPSGHLNHTWTLAIDEQIYIVWPLLIWLCKNEKQLIALCTATLLFSLFYRIGYNIHLEGSPSKTEYAAFINTFCRIDSFAAGSLLYCLLHFRSEWIKRNYILALLAITALLFISCGIADDGFVRTGFYMRNFGCTIAGLHFAGWLWVAVNKGNALINKILSNKILVYIGKISYSLYVFHWFILILMTTRIYEFILGKFHIDSYAFASIACMLLVFIVAMISYEYFEKPIIKLKKKFSYTKIKANEKRA